MQTIPAIIKALFDSESPQVLLIKDTATNGQTITLTEADVMANGFSIDRYTITGNKLEVGTAIAAEMTLKLNNFDGRFDNVRFEGVELKVQLGVTEGLGEPYYVDCGLFTCEEQPRTSTVITIHALDRMTIFDKYEPTLMGWIDESGNDITDENGDELLLAAELVFPCTVVELVEQVCNYCGATLVARPWSQMPNADVVLESMPNISQRITYRDIIRWCAGIMASCAYINYQGELDFIWYHGPDSGQTQYVSTADMRYSSDLAENDVTINGVSYTNNQGAVLVAGDSDYTVDMTGNFLMSAQAAQILTAVNNDINGFTYRPFSAEVVTAPYLEPFDIIKFTDKAGTTHDCIITNINYGLNTHTKLAGKGEPTAVSELASPAAMTPEQGTIIEQATQKVVDLDNSLNQESIFNRLTDNGQMQGMILADGQIYINASYIKTGILNADLIKTGKIQDDEGKNSWDLATGEFRASGSIESSDSEENKIVVDNGAIMYYPGGAGIPASSIYFGTAYPDSVLSDEGLLINGPLIRMRSDGNLIVGCGGDLIVDDLSGNLYMGATGEVQVVSDITLVNDQLNWTYAYLQFYKGICWGLLTDTSI